MATYTFDQLEQIVLSNQQTITAIQANVVPIPKMSVDVNDTEISDKTGWTVFGTIAGINGGLMFVGISLVATPTLDAHIQEPFIFKDF